MAHFAQIGENNKVINVIVVDNMVLFDEANATYDERLGIAHCQSLIPGRWVQTSYNNNIRKNFAGIGFTYDEGRDAFIPPSLFPSWVLDEETCHWNPPSPMPAVEGKFFGWDEPTVSWQEMSELTFYGNIPATQATIDLLTPPPPPEMISGVLVEALSTVDVQSLSTSVIEALSTAEVQNLSTTSI